MATRSARVDSMLLAECKPHNDKWRPGKRLKQEMEDKGFAIDYDEADGFWRACLYAPDGYRFTTSDAHCDCAVELSSAGIKKLMREIEKCDCDECKAYWQEQQA